ncbi:MAG: urease accessory protein [Candidatus Binatia bacterium]
MSAILLFGFLLGIRHALEADHVAAVATLATRSHRLRDTVTVAAWWGTGHAATLVVLGSILVVVGVSLPDALARSFEAIVGVVLFALGADVLRRLWARRVHFHLHAHGEAPPHLHAHAHAEDEEAAHDVASHDHPHPRGLLARSLAVGSIHGLAGSGALVLLSMESAGSPGRALAYLVLFALGSVAGMVLFTVAISLPLRLSARWLERTAGGLEAVLGASSMALGIWVALRAAAF